MSPPDVRTMDRSGVHPGRCARPGRERGPTRRLRPGRPGYGCVCPCRCRTGTLRCCCWYKPRSKCCRAGVGWRPRSLSTALSDTGTANPPSRHPKPLHARMRDAVGRACMGADACMEGPVCAFRIVAHTLGPQPRLPTRGDSTPDAAGQPRWRTMHVLMCPCGTCMYTYGLACRIHRQAETATTGGRSLVPVPQLCRRGRRRDPLRAPAARRQYCWYAPARSQAALTGACMSPHVPEPSYA